MFQSTHPRRVRRFDVFVDIKRKGFNPRTHVGCDKSGESRTEGLRGFNPRTHVGCDMGDY